MRMSTWKDTSVTSMTVTGAPPFAGAVEAKPSSDWAVADGKSKRSSDGAGKSWRIHFIQSINPRPRGPRDLTASVVSSRDTWSVTGRIQSRIPTSCATLLGVPGTDLMEIGDAIGDLVDDDPRREMRIGQRRELNRPGVLLRRVRARFQAIVVFHVQISVQIDVDHRSKPACRVVVPVRSWTPQYGHQRLDGVLPPGCLHRHTPHRHVETGPSPTGRTGWTSESCRRGANATGVIFSRLRRHSGSFLAGPARCPARDPIKPSLVWVITSSRSARASSAPPRQRARASLPAGFRRQAHALVIDHTACDRGRRTPPRRRHRANLSSATGQDRRPVETKRAQPAAQSIGGSRSRVVRCSGPTRPPADRIACISPAAMPRASVNTASGLPCSRRVGEDVEQHVAARGAQAGPGAANGSSARSASIGSGIAPG